MPTNTQAHSRLSAPPSSFRRPPAMRPRSPRPPSRSAPTHIVSALSSPSVLAAIAALLDWPDLVAVLNSCRTCRTLFLDPSLRDVLLSRLVPGYADAVRLRVLNDYHDIPVSIHDLDLLLISQRLPLHRYPTHALRLITALYPTLEEDYITTKLIALALAHSRFVLLLQALVHSSSSPVPSEPDDSYSKSRHLPSTRSPPKHHSGRHLNFPAPLSYLRDQQQHQPLSHAPSPDSPPPSKRSKHHSMPVRSTSTDYSHPFDLAHAIRPSADSLSSMISVINNSDDTCEPHEAPKKVRRRSLFRKSSITPPPPEEPRALRIYSSSWRKSAWNTGHSHPVGLHDFASLSASSELELKRPKRRFASTNLSSDSSACSSPVTSPSPLPRFHTGESSTGSSSPSTPIPTIMPSLPPSIRMTSPHDLYLATSRVRAPILRVFVPCTKMEVDSESVLLCERQLVEAGLWEHLSTGDIICNLGYIPPTSDDAAAANDDILDEDKDRASSRSGSVSPARYGLGYRGHGGPANTNNSRKWLLFNGDCLVPYTAPNLLPIENPISLPSPYYYAHLMLGGVSGNGYGNSNNFRFWIDKFPPVLDEIPQLSMVNVSGRVRSVKSTSGWAEVRKWVWTARFVRYRPTLVGSDEPVEEMGGGWLGEWVLEGVGTSEGRQELLGILNYGVVPGGPREWELVKEKSGGGRIWLKMVS